jgi:hypothetical protein
VKVESLQARLTPILTGLGRRDHGRFNRGTTFTNNSFTVYGSSGNNGDIYILETAT